MKTYFFTFGLGTPMKNRVQPIRATDYLNARKIMVAVYCDRWAFQYEEEDWNKGIMVNAPETTYLPALREDDHE